MLGIIRCRTLKRKPSFPKRRKAGQAYFGKFYLGKCQAVAGREAGIRHAGALDLLRHTLWQKWQNMSTVAGVVSYLVYKIRQNKYVH